MTLLFDDVLKLEDVGMLVKLCNHIRKYFDSTCHAPAEMLKKYSKVCDNDSIEFHKDRKIIDLLRLLRLRDHIVAKIHSNEFCKLNAWRKFYSLVQRDEL